VEQHQYKVMNTCYGFVHNEEDAEDLAQEVFLEVYNSIGTFREESKLSTWIYRICVTKSLDFLRKQKRKKRVGFLRAMFSQDQDLEQLPSSPATNPHVHLEQRERAEILRQAVDSLAENQKIAMTLSQYEDFSYQEIADVMDTTLSAVESLLHRAKKNLRKKLYHYYEKQF
jgi:RNA polymerase sigma-70 factor (ECF subfamily)